MLGMIWPTLLFQCIVFTQCKSGMALCVLTELQGVEAPHCIYCTHVCACAGVGDVCSYAEMNIRRHGNPGWSVFPESRPMSTQVEQAEMGKTEMSLVHFQVSRGDPCDL